MICVCFQEPVTQQSGQYKWQYLCWTSKPQETVSAYWLYE